MRLLRNRSRERISSSNQLFQARTRLACTPGGRVGRLPAGVTLAEKSTRYDTWHSAPNHMEPPSAAPRPGLRDAATHVCECVSAEERIDCIPDIGHPWSHLIPNTSKRGLGQPRLCASAVLEGHRRHRETKRMSYRMAHERRSEVGLLLLLRMCRRETPALHRQPWLHLARTATCASTR